MKKIELEENTIYLINMNYSTKSKLNDKIVTIAKPITAKFLRYEESYLSKGNAKFIYYDEVFGIIPGETFEIPAKKVESFIKKVVIKKIKKE
jgi:hypothetical protein